MKAHYITAAQKRAAALAAKEIVRDSNARVQYLWILSMYNCGLSPRTINRVAAEMENVCEKYKAYRVDGIADEAVKRDLAQIGIDAQQMQREQ